MAIFVVTVDGRDFMVIVEERCGDDWIPAAQPEGRAAIEALNRGEGE
jgi:hypothetical protein